MRNLELVGEGLTAAFLDDIRSRVLDLVLPKAESYFEVDATAYNRGRPSAKPGEMASNYYDYQPCVISALGTLAAEGNERALVLVRRIFDNAQHFIEVWREQEGYTFPLRRAQLHLALCYERLQHSIGPAESAACQALLIRTGEDLLAHFNGLQERVPALDNRGFGTGINHVAVAAEGIWKSGEVLGRPDWQNLAGAFNDRLIAYGHPDGYFEEHTNDAREGGPSLVYTPLTAGCAHVIQRWRNALDRDRFARCGAFYRQFTDGQFRAMAVADERANPHGLGSYGIAIHGLSAEGRGFLRLALDPEGGSVHLDGMSMEYLARLYHELDYMDVGEGAVPEPLQEGTFRITMPLGVGRSKGWTMGLSAMQALNREISPRGDYALDRQNLVYLSHADGGVILPGTKSKRNPLWSTVRKGDDAYPVRTGHLRMEADRAVAEVFYETFTVTVSWLFGEEPQLVLASDAEGPLTAQLVLEAGAEDVLCLDGERDVTLGDDEETFEDVRSIGSETWEVQADAPGSLIWYVSPFNPYSAGNVSAPGSRRSVFAVDWFGQVRFVFRLKQK